MSVNSAMNASVKRALLILGFSLVSPLVAKKAGERPLAEAPKCSSHGLCLVFLLSPSWDLCSCSQQKMLEENLRVAREVSAASSCIPNVLIGSMLDIMSLHIPMRQVLCRWVASGCVLFLGFPVPKNLHFLVRRHNLVTMYSGRRRNSFARCYKRSCEAITIICFQTLETFLPEYEYHYYLNGNNKFVLCHGLGPI